MSGTLKLRTIHAEEVPSTADLVFNELYERVVELDLAPGAKISEADVAAGMGVSRQPVRDAFYRLSRLGFLVIRPQRATMIAPISLRQVEQARFIRTAIELETVRQAASRATGDDLALLAQNLDQQRATLAAGDKKRFHALDDRFHQEICRIAGAEHAWTLIREKKAHMDRVRFLTLDVGAETAFTDHLAIFEALSEGNVKRAAKAVRAHLSRISDLAEKLRRDHGSFLADEET